MALRGLTLTAHGEVREVQVERAGAGFRFAEASNSAAPLHSAPAETLVLPGFSDAHVHLGLVDQGTLRGSAIGHVVDLGWDPFESLAWRHSDALRVDVAGPILTAVRGYPSDREWMPQAGVLELSSAAHAEASIAMLAERGCALIKVASNSTAGPVPSDAVLAAIVAAAHARSLQVVAHAEGAGEAMRMLSAGVDALAHTPFSEVLDDAQLRAMARSCAWISTLDIHGWGDDDEAFGIALANLRGFHAHGGRVRYGTDLGNGPLPIGLNAREISGLARAGLNGAEVLGTMLDADSFAGTPVLNLLPIAALDNPALIADVRTITPDTVCQQDAEFGAALGLAEHTKEQHR